MMKRWIAFIFALLITLTQIACVQTEPVYPAEYKLEEVTSYPVTLTDHAGREVTIEQEPQRLVSGYYISTSALIALGVEDRIVGIEAKANKRPIYSLSAPSLISLPSVGSAKEFDLEGCAALSPDLVILPLKLKNAAETLTSLGINVLLVNPESGEQLEQMIVMLATATNSARKAMELLSFTYGETNRLLKEMENAEKPTVYLAGNSSMLSTAGGGMYQSHMVETAGGINVAAEITDSYWVEISYEQLLRWDPEYIVLASDASYTVEDVLADPNLANARAIREKKVVKIPDNAEAWDSPIPGGVLGSVWLSSVLHPHTCPTEKSLERITAFYSDFYGFSYSEK